MRSPASKRILENTPQEVKTKVSNYAKQLINMKTPQEIKAEELIKKFQPLTIGYHDTIDCAKIAVEEIIKTEPPELSYMEYGSMSYWQEVLNCLNRM